MRQRVILDDRLLVETLLGGGTTRSAPALHTTSYWYHRACRAAVAGAGGHLSDPFAQVSDEHQARATMSLLQLTDDIGLPDPRSTVPLMADLARAHPRLNLLNLEAAAAAITLEATVWLSPEAARGILPAVLDAEHLPWEVRET